jgi:hypothetical protein
MTIGPTKRVYALARLDERRCVLHCLGARLGPSKPFPFLTLCSLLALSGGCILGGPRHQVAHPPGVDIQTNPTFAVVNGHDLKLNLYLPHGAQGRLPLVIWIRGDGWLRRSRHPCPIAPLTTRG